jgi:hypothetical protein
MFSIRRKGLALEVLGIVLLVGCATVCRAADLRNLPPNTWVEIKYTTDQPSDDPDEKGSFRPVGWNKVVYDPDGKRVLFYDRWVDKKHGGLTIYGNCLFGFDPGSAKLTPIKIDNWKRVDTKRGGYRTVPMPENDKAPTPASRHVYNAFDYVPDLKSVFICNGANQSIMIGDKLVGHDACDGAWRLGLKTNQWKQIRLKPYPSNRLDDAMAYCPDIRSLVYTGYNGQIWILDPDKGEWRKARQSPPPRTAFGRTICYDPTKKRMLLMGGGRLDAWMKGKAPEFRELYAFDPRTEEVRKLADCPTALYASHLAYDSKRQLFVVAAVFNKKEQPSGMFCYDPSKDAWHEIEPANSIPPHRGWFGWTKLCYDSRHDCFIGLIGDRFFAFRHVPAK